MSQILFETGRFSDLGGLEDSDVRRILDNFVFSLPGHLFLLETLKDKPGTKELAMALHKLNGTANSCGFVAIGRMAEAWGNAPDSDGCDYFSGLYDVIHASIREWHSLTENLKPS